MKTSEESLSEEPKAGEKTVLVVEDEGFSRKHVVMALAGLPGYAVLEAADGEQASDLLKEKPVDLMVLDLHLPGLSGLDLLHLVRAGELGAPADMPVVVVTGSNSEVTARIAGAMGVSAFLRKPVRALDLRQVVAAALG